MNGLGAAAGPAPCPNIAQGTKFERAIKIAAHEYRMITSLSRKPRSVARLASERLTNQSMNISSPGKQGPSRLLYRGLEKCDQTRSDEGVQLSCTVSLTLLPISFNDLNGLVRTSRKEARSSCRTQDYNVLAAPKESS